MSSQTEIWWRAQAPCHDQGELFYQENGPQVVKARRAALAICHACPYEIECLTYALTHNEDFGIWGGTTARERRRKRPQLLERISAPALP